MTRAAAGAVPREAPGIVFSLTDIRFDYPLPGNRRQEIIDQASLELRRGEVVSILGPSGCGKSTLLAIAAGLARCRSGSVRLNAEDTTGLPGKAGFMMQRDELLPTDLPLLG